MSHLRSLAVGWVFLLIVLSPLIIGWLVAGDGGVTAAFVFYLAVMSFVMLTLLAYVIGEFVRDELRRYW